ncbi:MAG TPA: septal ring lytic transglycosylase RlpA family protein [Solirubrobacteraceae bacterium]|nr:septal ring lytic transglycosylase RlpA family protein [Solirubrobacteraceae bacterium]
MTRPLRAGVTLGALATAGTLAAGATAAQSGSEGDARVTAELEDTHIRYGDPVAMRGRVVGADRAPVSLLFRPVQTGEWRQVDTDTTGEDGRFRLSADPLRRTGEARVVLGREAAPAAAAGEDVTGARSSEPALVRILPQLSASDDDLAVRVGRTASIRGQLRPGWEGRRVELQRNDGEGWDTVDTAATREGGRYTLRYKRSGTSPGAVRVRVVFTGDEANSPTANHAGFMAFQRRAQASWYGPGFYGRRTACGKTMSRSIEGVAHRWLPCGTMVALRHGDETVTVPVIDRGPYSGNREFDLAHRTRRDLGFGSTGFVWAATVHE